MEKRSYCPEYRISYLPLFPRTFFIEEARVLYKELINNTLQVKLVPAPTPMHTDHKIRVVEGSNPEWYSDLYYSTNRGKRKLFEKSLARLVRSEDQDFNIKNQKYSYDSLFRELIYSRLIEGYNERGRYFVEPNNAVRKYFGLEQINISKEEKAYLKKLNNYL